MNGLDITVCLLLGIFTVSGLLKGFIKGMASLVALIGGVVMAKQYYMFASDICTFFHIPNPNKATSYICVFLISYGIISILTLLLHKISKASRLSTLDRILGCILGFVKGLVCVLILITLLQIILPAKSPLLKHSALLPYSNTIMEHAKATIPKEFYSKIKI